MADNDNNNNNNKKDVDKTNVDLQQRKKREREEKRKATNPMDNAVVGTQRLFAPPKPAANASVEANVSGLFDLQVSTSSRTDAAQPLVDAAAVSAAITAAAAAVPLPPSDEEDLLLRSEDEGERQEEAPSYEDSEEGMDVDDAQVNPSGKELLEFSVPRERTK